MTTEHTAGPWVACAETEGLHAVRAPTAWNPLGMVICDVGYGPTTENNDANARLIASAPDLLAALQTALAVIADYLDYEHNGDPWTEDARAMGEMDIDDYESDGRMESARAAIAKATGAA